MCKIGMRNPSFFLSIYTADLQGRDQLLPCLTGVGPWQSQTNLLPDCHPESAWSNLKMSFLKEKMHRKLFCFFFPICIGSLQADLPWLVIRIAWLSTSDESYGRSAGSSGLLFSFCRNWRFYLHCQITFLLKRCLGVVVKQAKNVGTLPRLLKCPKITWGSRP